MQSGPYAGWGVHARFRGRLGKGVSDQHDDVVRNVQAGLRVVLPRPGLPQFPPEGTGKDGFFHLVDALQDVLGSFPGLLLPGKDAVQNADDLLLFGEGGHLKMNRPNVIKAKANFCRAPLFLFKLGKTCIRNQIPSNKLRIFICRRPCKSDMLVNICFGSIISENSNHSNICCYGNKNIIFLETSPLAFCSVW